MGCVIRPIAMTFAMFVFCLEVSGEPVQATGTVRLQDGFEQGAGAWKQIGEAEFSLDAERPHAGAQCVRIVVREGAGLAYQQYEQTSAPVAYGDEFRVTAWVRTEGVNDASGLYAALEFVDKGGQRVGIAHSNTAIGSAPASWQELVIEGRAPNQTERVATLHADIWATTPVNSRFKPEKALALRILVESVDVRGIEVVPLLNGVTAERIAGSL
jgi:hypothetical protein